MRVLFLSPGYPAEMPFFCRGLAAAGAEVVGVGDQPAAALPDMARAALADYLQVDSLWDEAAVVKAVRAWPGGQHLDRVECLWEPGMLVAARVREALGLPGLTHGQTVPFRDKEAMKQVLDRAGLRTPRHRRASGASAIREAAAAIGYPLIVKPIAGAGSADTHRVADRAELDRVIGLTKHVPTVSVEEFIEGREFTFDTICADGRILYHNITWYRPRPLLARTHEWISPQMVALRHPEQPDLAAGVRLGQGVLQALGFQTGFTHMEWFLTDAGEAVFGEIGARPPGARSVDLMNLACDFDAFTAWAEALCHGRITQPIERRWNVCQVVKRAQGQGRIQRIEGLGNLMARYAPWICAVELLPVGAPRRDWKATLLSDGWIAVRHPHLPTCLEMGDAIAGELQLHAG
jgi:biotin carboxylase